MPFHLPPAPAGHPQSGCGRADGRPGGLLAACGAEPSRFDLPSAHGLQSGRRLSLQASDLRSERPSSSSSKRILVWTLIKFRSASRPARARARARQHDARDRVDGDPGCSSSIFIAIPTVRTIFKTQAKARADALQVEVIGHQWWWEFRYPQYTAIDRRRTSCICRSAAR